MVLFFHFFFEQEQPKGLTNEQMDFLNRMDIGLESVFDAKGMSHSEYKLKMKELNKLVAYNVTPCQKSGHTLRYRDGHCCQCNPSQRAYREMYYSADFVYIAGTLTGKIIKIGAERIKEHFETRSKSINRTEYAGYDDWEILFQAKSEYAGRIESKTKSALKDFAFLIYYYHGGAWHKSTETFKCSYSTALEYLKEVCLKYGYTFDIQKENTERKKFEFGNGGVE